MLEICNDNLSQKDVLERLGNALGVTPEFLEGSEPETPISLPKKITVTMAAKCMGVNPERVRHNLRLKSLGKGCQDFDIGYAFPSLEENGKWKFDIQAYKLHEYVGVVRFNEFFGITN